MGVEKRAEKRVPCRSCMEGYFFTEKRRAPILFYYSNISSKGLCAYGMDLSRLSIGDVLYLVRSKTKKVLYEICWMNQADMHSNFMGLHILNNYQICDKKMEQRKYLMRAIYETKRKSISEMVVS